MEIQPGSSGELQEDFQWLTTTKKGGKSCVFIKKGFRWRRIYLEDIVYVESDKEFAHLHVNGTKFTVRKSLKDLGELLPETGFIRIHKSFLISQDYVVSFYGNTVELEVDGEIKPFPISRTYKAGFRERFLCI
ncbi:MAG: LytTR family DNA-binding domain-containing protein [Bacteroidota bacterium]